MERLQQSQGGDVTSQKHLQVPKEEPIVVYRESHRQRNNDVGEGSFAKSPLPSSYANHGSTRSRASGDSSINNPKLLSTIEEDIERLIIPELNALKAENRAYKRNLASQKKNWVKRESCDGDTTYESESMAASQEN
jgi:hypothetical protein